MQLPPVLVERARADGDRPFLVDVDGRSVTYAEFLSATRRWAAVWRTIGVGPDDVVVTMQANTIDSVAGWIGLSWLGAVEAPINTDYRGDLLVHALDVTGAKVVALEQRFADRLREVADRLPHVETVLVLDAHLSEGLPWRVEDARTLLDRVSAAAGLHDPQPWDLGAILFTSGTTGPSKAVCLPWGQLHSTAIATFPVGDITSDDVIYSNGPTYHVGAKVFPFLAAIAGASAVLRGSPSLTHWVEDHERFGITTSVANPALFNAWLTTDAEPGAERRLKNLLAPYPVPLLAEFKERFGARSCGAYNMTELSIPICSPSWDAVPPGSCGRLREGYPGYEVRVVDEHDVQVPDGEIGELIVRSSAPWTINAGYLNMPEATAEAWRNGWFHTGDAMRRDADGWFYFVDRLKDAIRRRGENISSLEVEAIVTGHPDVAECAAVAVRKGDAPGSDEEVKVVVVRTPGAELTSEALIDHLIGVMPRFMIPRYIEFADELPKTPTMKVRKAELRRDPLNANTWDREAAGVALPR